MFEPTEAEKKIEQERRQRYEYILSLQKRDPDAYQRIPAQERMNAARWNETVNGQAMPATKGGHFNPIDQFDALLDLRERDKDDYDRRVSQLSATTRMSLHRYAEQRKAAGR